MGIGPLDFHDATSHRLRRTGVVGAAHVVVSRSLHREQDDERKLQRPRLVGPCSELGLAVDKLGRGNHFANRL
jgi:hypothetical protein